MHTRTELKYLLTESVQDSLYAFCRAGMKADPNGPEGSYQVHNIYYDSPDRRSLEEKLEGLVEKTKLRWRWYGDRAPSRGFFEVKRRLGYVSGKSRAAFPWPDPRLLPSALLAQSLDADAQILDFEPVAYLAYRRRAFFHNGYRCNFDDQLRGFPLSPHSRQGVVFEPRLESEIERSPLRVFEVKCDEPSRAYEFESIFPELKSFRATFSKFSDVLEGYDYRTV